MQKFRFLLPLVILTLIVIAISYGVRQYANSNNTNSDTTIASEDVSSPDALENAETEEAQPSGGFLARIFGTKKTNTTQSQSSSQATITVTPMPSPISITFNQTQVDVPINEERQVFISLDTGTNLPTAYTFNMSFDPKSITVVKVEPGDIWQQASIFTKANKIDNVNGRLSFSAGQALGTQKGNGKTLIKISVKAKSTQATGTELKIEESSKFAYVGLDYAIPLKSKSIEIQVTK